MGEAYLESILRRELVDTGPQSPVRSVQGILTPLLRGWAGTLLSSVHPSGSFAKGTANNSGTDIDLFVSLSHNTTNTLKELYEGVYELMRSNGYTPRRQNVSINVRVNGYDVDLVPAKQQNSHSDDHSLWRRRAETWTKTNVIKHINLVSRSGRTSEIRILKLWRNQKGIDFPSFYLEMTTINALSGQPHGALAKNVWKVFHYLRDTFPDATVIDPANSANVLSDDLTAAERAKVRSAAVTALAAKDWKEIVK